MKVAIDNQLYFTKQIRNLQKGEQTNRTSDETEKSQSYCYQSSSSEVIRNDSNHQAPRLRAEHAKSLLQKHSHKGILGQIARYSILGVFDFQNSNQNSQYLLKIFRLGVRQCILLLQAEQNDKSQKPGRNKEKIKSKYIYTNPALLTGICTCTLLSSHSTYCHCFLKLDLASFTLTGQGQ